MSKIFISHSSKDSDFVKRLAIDLISLDIPIWLDVFELSIGDSLYDKIFSEINESNFLIVVISKNYNSSLWTSKEFKAILSKEDRDKKKYLIPIKIDDSEVPLEIFDRIHANFEDNYENNLRHLSRFFRKEEISIKSLPLSKRQIILSFNNYVEIDITLLKNILVNLYDYKDSEIKIKQIYFYNYSEIDQLTDICKQNIKLGKSQSYNNEIDRVEKFISLLEIGIVKMLNDFRSVSNPELIVESIYWYSRIFMDTIYAIFIMYLDQEQFDKFNFKGKIFSHFAFGTNLGFPEFYKVQGSASIDIFDKDDRNLYTPVIVSENCFNNIFKGSYYPVPFMSAYSNELLYKFYIPQNVFSHVSNQEKNKLLTNFKNLMIGVK